MIQLELSETDFTINGVTAQFPILLNDLKLILGEDRITSTKHNTIFTWDEHGILAYSQNGKSVESLLLCLDFETYKFSPKQKFTGRFMLNNQEVIDYYYNNKDKRVKLFKGDNGGAFINN